MNPDPVTYQLRGLQLSKRVRGCVSEAVKGEQQWDLSVITVKVKCSRVCTGLELASRTL